MTGGIPNGIRIPRMVWYVNPESGVYHYRENCPALRHTYWPVHGATGKRRAEIIAQRTPCRRCSVRRIRTGVVGTNDSSPNQEKD